MVNLWGKQEGDIISKVGKWGLEGVKDLVQYRRAIKWRGKDSHLVLPLSSVLRLLGCLSSSREPGPRGELMQWGVETENDILRCLFLFLPSFRFPFFTCVCSLQMEVNKRDMPPAQE